MIHRNAVRVSDVKRRVPMHELMQSTMLALHCSGVLTALAGRWPAGAMDEVGDAAGHRRYASYAAVGDQVDKE